MQVVLQASIKGARKVQVQMQTPENIPAYLAMVEQLTLLLSFSVSPHQVSHLPINQSSTNFSNQSLSPSRTPSARTFYSKQPNPAVAI